MSASRIKAHHRTIRAWAEARGGRPSAIRTGPPGGIVRLDFGGRKQALDRIDWDEFFQIFDENALAFVTRDEAAEGEPSRFGAIIGRE